MPAVAAAKTIPPRRKSAPPPPRETMPAWARKLGMSEAQYRLVKTRRAEIEALLKTPMFKAPLHPVVEALPFWARGLDLNGDDYEALCALEALKEGTLGVEESAEFWREIKAKAARRRARQMANRGKDNFLRRVGNFILRHFSNFFVFTLILILAGESYAKYEPYIIAYIDGETMVSAFKQESGEQLPDFHIASAFMAFPAVRYQFGKALGVFIGWCLEDTQRIEVMLNFMWNRVGTQSIYFGAPGETVFINYQFDDKNRRLINWRIVPKKFTPEKPAGFTPPNPVDFLNQIRESRNLEIEASTSIRGDFYRMRALLPEDKSAVESVLKDCDISLD